MQSKTDVALRCKEGAISALKMAEQGKLGRQINEEFARHSGRKLRYHNRKDLINLLTFYAGYPG